MDAGRNVGSALGLGKYKFRFNRSYLRKRVIDNRGQAT